MQSMITLRITQMGDAAQPDSQVFVDLLSDI